MERRAIAGPAADKGLTLDLLPFEQRTWEAWKTKHPQTRVLSTDTGYRRSYERNPYANYFGSQRLMFQVNQKYPDQSDLKNKDMLLVVHVNDAFKAYPQRRVSKTASSNGSITDTVGGKQVRIEIDSDGNLSAHYANGSGQPPVSYMFWFSFQSAFSPEDAALFEPGR